MSHRNSRKLLEEVLEHPEAFEPKARAMVVALRAAYRRDGIDAIRRAAPLFRSTGCAGVLAHLRGGASRPHVRRPRSAQRSRHAKSRAAVGGGDRGDPDPDADGDPDPPGENAPPAGGDTAERLCACGCGESMVGMAAQAKYRSDACRKRHKRALTEEEDARWNLLALRCAMAVADDVGVEPFGPSWMAERRRAVEAQIRNALRTGEGRKAALKAAEHWLEFWEDDWRSWWFDLLRFDSGNRPKYTIRRRNEHQWRTSREATA